MKRNFTKILYIVVLMVWTHSAALSQFFVPIAGSNQINCGQNTTLCDHAGCASDYNNDADGFTVIQAFGSTSITISGSYNLAPGDQIVVYNGAGLGGTVLVTLSGSGTYNYSGLSGQQLTIRFSSDANTTAAGFSFSVTYNGSCGYPSSNFGSSGAQSFSCATNRIFFDNGGLAADYSDNANSTIILNNTGTGIYTLSGSYLLENGFDFVRIYNGVGTLGTLLQSYTGSGNFSFTSQPGQTVTVQFESDATVVDAGFQLNVQHYGGCSCPPNIVTASASPSSICVGSSTQLIVNGTSQVDNYAISYPVYSPLLCSGSGGGIGPSGDDAVSSTQTLPFPFTFFGNTYTQFGISTNGNIQFGAGPYNAAYIPSGNGIPTTSVNNFIALNFGDWIADPGVINWFVQGTAPNRVVVICFNGLYPYPAGSSGLLSGQILLYEGSNIIDLVIASSFMGTNAFTYDLQTQGIQEQLGVGFPVPGRNSSNWSANNSTVRFSPTLNYTYQWSPANFLNSTTLINPVASNVTSSQTYTVIASVGTQCTQTASVDITINPIPNPTISGDLSICNGESTTITAAGGLSFNWYDGSSSASVTLTPALNTEFTVTVSNGGCNRVATANVTVTQRPLANLIAFPAELCLGQSTTLSAQGGGSYSWSNGAGSASTTFSPTSSGFYFVTVTNNGCAAVDSVFLFVSSTGLPVINCPDDISLVGCEPVAIFETPSASDPCALPSCTSAPLETILANFLSTGAAISAVIPNPYNFDLDGPGGATSVSINDGGNDMYDVGNLISTNLSGSSFLNYTDGNIIGSSFLGTNGRYFTAKINNIFIMAADINNVSVFNIVGNNGADGLGTVNGFTFTATEGCMQYNVFVKRVFGTTDPSINQIFIVPSGSSPSHTFSSDSDLSDHFLSNLSSTSRIYYLLLAGNNGYEYSDAEIQSFVQNFLIQTGTSAYVPNPLSVFQTGGLPSGSAFPIGNTVVTYTATGINGTSLCRFNVTVAPTPGPLITCPADITLASCNPVATFSEPEAIDPCVAPCQLASLAQILSNFNNNVSGITASISNPYNFTLDGPGAAASTYIADGGNDMYDVGNVLNTNISTNIPYTAGVISASNAFGYSGQYFTQKFGNLFVMAADINGINSFFISGNNGADGAGNVNGFSYTVTVGCETYDIFVKRVNGTSDPSINQIFIVSSSAGATHSFSSDSDNGFHELSNLNGANRIFYLLLAGDAGYTYSNVQIQNIVLNFLTQINATTSNPVSITQISGLPSGSAFPLGNNIITFQAQGPSGTSSCSFNVNVVPGITVDAGPNQIVCANNPQVTLNGTVTNATGGIWTSSGNGSFALAGSLSTSYMPSADDIAAGSVIIRLTSTGNGSCPAAFEDILVTINPPPVVNAGNDTLICANLSEILLNGSTGVGNNFIWSSFGSGSFSPSNTDSVASYLPSAADIAAGSVLLRLNSTGNGSCNAVFDDISLMFSTVSTAPNIAPISGTVCPNSSLTLTATGGNSGSGSFISWYSGPNGGGTNLGNGRDLTVYPVGNTTYYVRREDGVCGPSSDDSIQINTKTYIYAANASSSNTYCTDVNGWHHFYIGDDIIFSVRGNLSGAAPGFPRANINLNNNYFQSPGITPICNVTTQEEKFEMARSWNLDFGGGSPLGTYEIRFYFQPAEKTVIETAAANWISSYGSCGYSYKYSVPNGFYWFKNSGSAYVAPLYDDIQYPATTGSTFNAVNYAEWSGIPNFSGGSGAVTLVPDPLLNLDLLYFKGKKENHCNHLYWETIREENSLYFELQRSVDAINFETIAEIDAAHFSISPRNYAFDDFNPQNGYNYYRLRLHDNDGNVENSVLVLIENDVNNSFSLYPNPANDEIFYMQHFEEETEILVEITDLLGQKILEKKFSTRFGFNKFEISLSQFVSASYYFRIIIPEKGQVQSRKFVKK